MAQGHSTFGKSLANNSQRDRNRAFDLQADDQAFRQDFAQQNAAWDRGMDLARLDVAADQMNLDAARFQAQQEDRDLDRAARLGIAQMTDGTRRELQSQRLEAQAELLQARIRAGNHTQQDLQDFQAIQNELRRTSQEKIAFGRMNSQEGIAEKDRVAANERARLASEAKARLRAIVDGQRRDDRAFQVQKDSLYRQFVSATRKREMLERAALDETKAAWIPDLPQQVAAARQAEAAAAQAIEDLYESILAAPQQQPQPAPVLPPSNVTPQTQPTTMPATRPAFTVGQIITNPAGKQGRVVRIEPDGTPIIEVQ